jgi:energy-coupling factor transport system ATP-binding protein
LENLALPAEEIRARVAEALEATGLDALRTRAPHALSGGQQQRLAFACALALRPELIVLDEPTSQLDPENTAEVFRLMARLREERGTAFIVTGHASEEMAATCDRILTISGGRITADGTPRAVYGDAVACARERVRPPEVATVFHQLAELGLVAGEAAVTMTQGAEVLRKLPEPAAFAPLEAAPPSRGRPILSLMHVSHAYPGGVEALRDVSLDVHRGDYTLLIGENGAGKSTLLKNLLGLLHPTRGQVMLDGVPLATLPAKEIARRIGYVPQNPDRQLFNPTVEAEVGFSLRVRPGMSEADKTRRVDAALEELGLTALRKAHPFALSKGDRARVVVAAVLVLEPEVLVFDEPTTGQDAEGARAILDLTRRLHAAGRTVVVVTHHLYLMPGYARRAVVLGGGRVLRDGALREVYHDFEALAASSLRPTQAAALAREVNPAHRAVTAGELAASFTVAAANREGRP